MKQSGRSIGRTVLYIVLVLVVLLIYAYGWEVTDINLDEPQEETRQRQVVRALRGLLSPDLFDRDQESEIAYAYFDVPCDDTPPDQPPQTEGQPYVTVDPTCGETRDQVRVEGFNFRPFTEGFVRWVPPGGRARSLGRIRTDGEGHFSNVLRVPSGSEAEEPSAVEVEIVWGVGWPRPSEALRVTVEKMIETIFLALMATTLGVIIAIPISFIAAQNMMRPITAPLAGLLAALLPLPLGWVVGRWLFAPVGDLALRVGGQGWLGVVVLVVAGVALYFVIMRLLPMLDELEGPWLTGSLHYLRMLFFILILVTIAGLLAGVGLQAGGLLEGVLGGVLGSIVSTVAELTALLLPVLGGIGGMVILGALSGALLAFVVTRITSPWLERVLGLILGAATAALLVYLIYRGVWGFYNPGEPAPFIWYVTAGAAVVGGVGGFLAGADYQAPIGMVIYYIVRTILNVLRSVEPLIMAIVFVIWVGIGPFAGVLALTLHSIAALAKLYSEQIESIDPGPVEAILATGATRLQMMIYAVVPQIVPPYLAFTLYRWDINVRMSTIIGFVGGGGIGQVLKQWIDLLQYNQAGVATFAIAIVVALLDYVSARARERIT